MNKHNVWILLTQITKTRKKNEMTISSENFKWSETNDFAAAFFCSPATANSNDDEMLAKSQSERSSRKCTKKKQKNKEWRSN